MNPRSLIALSSSDPHPQILFLELHSPTHASCDSLQPQVAGGHAQQTVVAELCSYQTHSDLSHCCPYLYLAAVILISLG